MIIIPAPIREKNKMNPYTKLLSIDRLRLSRFEKRTILTESESDRGRILFSPPFRRLQQKAQVFSMEPNAAVRSRLTHSLEVAQTGRYIADLVGMELKKANLATEEQCGAIVNFVETACLMHDIGNPPFGHFGEAAIQKWFSESGEHALKEAVGADNVHRELIKKALADFLEFDGNPQGLRIVTRLQWNTDEFGLNLTKTTLASYLKYLRAPKVGFQPAENTRFQKKAGFFSTEEPIVRSVWNTFEYNFEDPQRFPLAYIMEAADDIAYCISDLEDSIEKGLLDEKKAFADIQKKWRESSISSESPGFEEIDNALENAVKGEYPTGKEFSYTDFRTSLNTMLVRFAASQYVTNHTQILSGQFGTLIPDESAPGTILDILKKYCKDHVYCHESVQRIELAGYTAISGLLDHFSQLLSCNRERFLASLEGKDKDPCGQKIITEKKLLSLFPGRHKKVYLQHVKEIEEEQSDESVKAVLEWNARAHLITDFVSGMTDDFAMNTYRTLSGMRL